VNEEGAMFYSRLLDALAEHNIEPWVTLYHWDLPSALVDRFGGWLGPRQKVMSAFGDYARVCFQRFGDRVKNWMTINEPWCVAVLGHSTDMHAPGQRADASLLATDSYIAAHNLLLAHAEAVRIYRQEFAAVQRGKIGIVLNVNYRSPLDASEELDRRAAQRALDFEMGWFADPIFSGDYPLRMRKTCGKRLPRFTDREKKLVRGSTDFLGLNYYYSTLVKAPTKQPGKTRERRNSGGLNAGSSWFADMGVRIEKDPCWEKTDTGWYVTPWGLRNVLKYAQRRYEPKEGIYITENGCAFEPEDTALLDAAPGALVPAPFDPDSPVSEDFVNEIFHDPQRVKFLRSHLAMVHSALASGVDVRGYFVWSLLDNFEWAEGYKKRFGIVRVDFATQKRTIKESGHFYADVISKHGFSMTEDDVLSMTGDPGESSP